MCGEGEGGGVLGGVCDDCWGGVVGGAFGCSTDEGSGDSDMDSDNSDSEGDAAVVVL